MMCSFFRTQTSDTQSLSFKCDAQCTTAFVDSYSSCERKKLQVQNSIGTEFHCFRRQDVRPLVQDRLEPWEGLLCCVHGQDTLLSQYLSPPRCINGYQQMLPGVTLRWLSGLFPAAETGISSCLMSHLARTMQALPTYM